MASVRVIFDVSDVVYEDFILPQKNDKTLSKTLRSLIEGYLSNDLIRAYVHGDIHNASKSAVDELRETMNAKFTETDFELSFGAGIAKAAKESMVREVDTAKENGASISNEGIETRIEELEASVTARLDAIDGLESRITDAVVGQLSNLLANLTVSNDVSEPVVSKPVVSKPAVETKVEEKPRTFVSEPKVSLPEAVDDSPTVDLEETEISDSGNNDALNALLGGFGTFSQGGL